MPDGGSARQQLFQQFNVFRCQFRREYPHPGNVATRPAEAGDQPLTYGLIDCREDDRNGLQSPLWRQTPSEARPPRNERSNSQINEFSRQRRQSVITTFRPPKGDCQVLPLNKSAFPQAPGGTLQLRAADSLGERLLRNPITGIAGCCARAASGHAAAAPPSSVMNSRRLMLSPLAEE